MAKHHLASMPSCNNGRWHVTHIARHKSGSNSLSHTVWQLKKKRKHQSRHFYCLCLWTGRNTSCSVSTTGSLHGVVEPVNLLVTTDQNAVTQEGGDTFHILWKFAAASQFLHSDLHKNVCCPQSHCCFTAELRAQTIKNIRHRRRDPIRDSAPRFCTTPKVRPLSMCTKQLDPEGNERRKRRQMKLRNHL